MPYAQNILTPLGFKRKRYEDYRKELEALYRQEFGEDINLGDDSPYGRIVKIQALQRAEENELAEYIYKSSSVENAEGAALDAAVKKRGMTRFTGRHAIGPKSLSVAITPGETLPAGFLVATPDDVTYRTTTTYTDADGDGVIIADIEAVEPGPVGNVSIGAITVIKSPLRDVTAVTNIAPTYQGRNRETDAELRARYFETGGAEGGYSTPDAIRAALLSLPDVRAAKVFVNNKDEPDAEGRPPHSYAPVVLGGQREEIARAIFSKASGGIQSYGAEVVEVTDSSGEIQQIGFSYAENVMIDVTIDAKRNAAFPANGRELIIRSVVNYIGGEAFNEFYKGLGMGESVVHAILSGRIVRDVPGLDDLTVTIRKEGGTFGAGNISIGGLEVAETDQERVTVNVS